MQVFVHHKPVAVAAVFPAVFLLTQFITLKLGHLCGSHFEAVEARFLRASFSAFVDVLTLATKVIEQFGPKEGI